MPPISAQALFYLIAWIGGMVFTAGGAWVKQRQTHRDVNGIGSKMRRYEALLLRWADTAEKREQLARALEGK